MEKLSEVEAARTLMIEAMNWSVVRWLREKKRVRKTADQANAALDRLSEEIRQRWAHPLRAAYAAIPVHFSAARSHKAQCSSSDDSNIVLVATQMKACNDEADRARMDAEDTFDKAEKQLST